MKLWETLRADAFRYTGREGIRPLFGSYLRDPGFRFTYYLRKVAYYAPKRKSWGVFAYIYNRLWLNHYRFRYGFDLSPQTQIGPGFYIGHFGGIVVSPYAVLGSNVNIAQGVTIGATNRGNKAGVPVVQDRVWIGAHAILVGKITIGQDALIAPGAYVNFDVPEKAVVLGNPGKIVADTGSAGYVNRIRSVRSDDGANPVTK
jgi:serine O-acetyltransferase